MPSVTDIGSNLRARPKSPPEQGVKRTFQESNEEPFECVANKKPKSTPSLLSSLANLRGNLPHTDVLFKPELLYQLHKDQDVQSKNPLLEFCLDGGFKPSARESRGSKKKPLPPLLQCCSAEHFGRAHLDELASMCQEIKGCDINDRDEKGCNAIHYLIQGCSKDTFMNSLHGIYLLTNQGIDLRHADHLGNTAMTSVSNLLEQGLFSEATILAYVLLQANAEINHVNSASRTLLSYSVSYGDASATLTRLLLNFGAKVWPAGLPLLSVEGEENVVEQLNKEREQSSFTWFLRSVIQRGQGLTGTDETLHLLCQAMGEEPLRMGQHVTRVMMHLGRSASADGPLFLQVKTKMTPFWSQPHPLKYLCLKKIRQTIGPKNLSDQQLTKLDIPSTVMQYLQLA